MLRQWKIKCHKHCRPNDSVESHDILCYHVNVSRPELVKIIVLLVPETKCRNIVRKCVYPNVNNVLVIKCNRNTPLESGSWYTKILKTGLDKVVYKLSGSCLWLEIICLSEKLLYPISKWRHLEEVSLLLSLCYLSVTLRTTAVLVKLWLSPEAFARRAVFALVFALVNIALVIKSLEDLLNSFNVIIVSSSDVSVIADVHVAPKLFESLDYLINIFLRCNTLFSSLLFDFQTMLVSACEEHDIIALHTSVSGNRIAGNSGVAVTDMRITGRVIYRGSDIKRFFLHIKDLRKRICISSISYIILLYSGFVKR